MTDQWDTKQWLFTDIKFPFSQPTGWQCPVCGTVYSPTVMTCFKKHRKPRKPKADKT